MPISGFSSIGDLLTEALVSGDFTLYQKVLDLPLTIVPMGESPYILSDETALRRDFLLYHSVLKLHGVTDIFREVRNVLDEGAGVYRIVCRVHMMVRANRIADSIEKALRGGALWFLAVVPLAGGLLAMLFAIDWHALATAPAGSWWRRGSCAPTRLTTLLDLIELRPFSHRRQRRQVLECGPELPGDLGSDRRLGPLELVGQLVPYRFQRGPVVPRRGRLGHLRPRCLPHSHRSEPPGTAGRGPLRRRVVPRIQARPGHALRGSEDHGVDAAGHRDPRLTGATRRLEVELLHVRADDGHVRAAARVQRLVGVLESLVGVVHQFDVDHLALLIKRDNAISFWIFHLIAEDNGSFFQLSTRSQYF